MGLFKNLLRLFPESVPQENFLTEIVAYLFRADPDLLEAWLSYFNLADADQYTDISIDTQQRFARLDEQFSDSIVDMTINLSDGIVTDTLFLEAKIGAKEGKDQLQRYAEQLAQLPDRRNRILLYITRDDEHPQLNSISPLVQFRHLHWYEFHRFLQEQPYNQIVQELIVFMKEATDEGKRLALDHELSAQAVLARSPIAREIMDQTLQGRVSKRFEEVVGPITGNSLPDQQSMLAQWGVYALFREFEQSQWRCWMGYRLDVAGDRPPKLELFLQVAPGARRRPEIIRAMKSICSRPGWQPDDLDQYTWSGIFYEREIPAELIAEGFVEKIESLFMDLIGELAEVKKQYAHLPW